MCEYLSNHVGSLRGLTYSIGTDTRSLRSQFPLRGFSEIRKLSALFDRAAIRKYKPPAINLSRSGSDSVCIPTML